MNSEELKQKHQKLAQNSNKTLNNMHIISDESKRVASIAHDSRTIIKNLDNEFESQTGLDGMDIVFLFFATAMQCARVFLINKITEIDKAGTGNKNEDFLHSMQSKIFSKFDDGTRLKPFKYYAPINQILLGRGVPYDATAYGSSEIKALKIFKGANHRFATLGHDPVLGLIFGTTNILTNTITCVKTPIITSFHVTYDADIKNPKITSLASTLCAFNSVLSRFDEDKKSIVAALIKQIIHIGTDLYTPKGIQIPGANLILSNKNAEKLTEYVNTGEILKIGTSAGISIFINFLVSVFHNLLYNEEKHNNREVYNVKTRKIVMLSNTIASGLNIGYVGANIAEGNKEAIRNLDIGGLIITIHRLLTDGEYIRRIKEEFVLGGFDKLIQGDTLNLQEVK